MRKVLALVVSLLSALAHAATYNVTSASDLLSANSSAVNGDTINLAAGTYHVAASIPVRCGVTYTGPIATPATAMITTSTANIALFQMSGGCTSGTTIEYLHLDGAGAFSTDGQNYSNINILHNQMTSIPAEESCAAACESIFFNVRSGTTISNIDIEYNSIGDPNSCVAGENVDDGSCAGVIVNTVNAAAVVNFIVQYNNFFHLQEGVHFPPVPFNPGSPGATCDNCVVQYNFFDQIHRIQIEMQIGVINHPYLERYNVVSSPLDTNANAGEFAFSDSCCQFGPTQGTPTNTYIDASSNLIYDPDPLTAQYGISWGFEAWGNGAHYNNNLIQGYVCAGIVWGYGSNWTASNNTMQSSIMQNGTPCPFYTPLKGGFIISEFPNSPGAQTPPTQIGNVFSGATTAVTSVAPTISPASGAQNFPLTVTLTDPGYASGPVPLGNTGIWYTTDGSTPVPGAAQYLPSGGSFLLSSPATVNAIGMWGTQNQPKSYPAGFGFLPSPVVSAVYQDASPKLVSAYLVSKGGSTTLPLNRTLQFIAHCVYSDGTTVVLPDSNGDVVTAWNTSNHAIAKISSLGHVTPFSLGTVLIEGFIGNLEASTFELTVTPPITSNVQTAIIQPASAALPKSPGPVTPAPVAPVADKVLVPLWKVMTPGGGSGTISNGHLLLNVPGGTNHDTLTPSNHAVRVVQPIDNTDFDVSIKIDSAIQASNPDTSQGLMVLSDDGAFITFALTTDGTNIGLVARTVNAGGSTTVFDNTNFNEYQNPLYLRLARSGDAYRASYSIDGAHWTQATSFTDIGTYTSIGPFASNYNDNPEKAVPIAMSVEWFKTD